ncbi:MAG: Na/Pi cotransporter family protein, partial [Candidatus Sedimenticola sp. 6PFRAG1]
DTQTQEFLDLMAAVNELENIGDTIETNMVVLGNQRIDTGVSISQPTRKVLTDFHQAIQKALGAAIQAVSQINREAAEVVINMKQEIANLANSAEAHQAERLVAEEPNRIPAYTIEIDIIEKQKRIYNFARRMAEKAISTADQTDNP